MPTLQGPELLPKSNQVDQVILFLHGLGSNGDDLISLAPYFDQFMPENTAYLSPNAPFKCELVPYGFQWFGYEMKTDEYLYPGVNEAANTLSKYIDEIIERFQIKYSDIILVGFSQGTMTSLYYALGCQNPPKAVIGYSGALICAQYLEKFNNLPICLIHGEADDLVPCDKMYEAQEFLSDKNINIDICGCPGLGHSINELGINKAKEFLTNMLIKL